MLVLGLMVARRLVLWPYLSCVVCRDVWRRKLTMEDYDRVLEMDWICLVRLMMLHCLSPTTPNFASRNTSALLILDDIWILPSSQRKLFREMFIYLNITTIADIVTACGQFITKEAYTQGPNHMNPSTRGHANSTSYTTLTANCGLNA